MNSGATHIDARFVRFGWPGCPDLLGQLKDAIAQDHKDAIWPGYHKLCLRFTALPGLAVGEHTSTNSEARSSKVCELFCAPLESRPFPKSGYTAVTSSDEESQKEKRATGLSV